MAVSTPKWLTSALTWRWTPTLALLGGSLLYVGVAILAVPSEIDFSGAPKASEDIAAPPAEAEPAAATPFRARRTLPAPAAAAPEEPAPAVDPEVGNTETPARRALRRRIVDPVITPPPDAPPAEAAPAEPPAGAIVRPFDPNSVPPPNPADSPP